MSDIGDIVEEFLNDYLEDFVPYSGEAQVIQVLDSGGSINGADYDIDVSVSFQFDGGTDWDKELIDLIENKFNRSMITAGNNEDLSNIKRAFNKDYDYDIECVLVQAYEEDAIEGEFDEIIIHMYFSDTEGLYA